MRPGDTVLVTGAAGAVGTLAGQLARLLGAGRVIGSTRSPHKAERLRAELGYDAVLLPGATPFAEQLAAAAPDGIDVLLDTVGGEQLTAAVGAARRGARFALVGALSGQLSADPDGDGATSPRRSTASGSSTSASRSTESAAPTSARSRLSGPSASASGCAPARSSCPRCGSRASIGLPERCRNCSRGGTPGRSSWNSRDGEVTARSSNL